MIYKYKNIELRQVTYLTFIHDLDDRDIIHAKKSAMLGLPYQSAFTKDVKIGGKESFVGLSVWMGIRKIIDRINANAAA